MLRLPLVLLFLAAALGAKGEESPVKAEVRSYKDKPYVENWQQKVGARTRPNRDKMFCVNDFGGKNSEYVTCTAIIQNAIDSCANAGGGVVWFKPGIYATGSIFLKSNVELRVDKGVMLVGDLDDESFPYIRTRAAGIEMDWRAALINVRGEHNVAITGEGVIHGRGSRWWAKFHVALPEYKSKGLRWAVDYDISRPLLCQVYESTDVTIENVTMLESPFWTVHIVYSHNVTVDGVTIRNNDAGYGFSTDGVNVDSSVFVLVQNCDASCNDDCYTLKAGMNADGLRVGIPAQYSIYRNNIARQGHGGIVFGSDMSGGIRHIEVYGLKIIGPEDRYIGPGIRFKSARVRGGVVEDLYIHDIEMENVTDAIAFILNWFPEYSYPDIPEGGGEIPPHWKAITAPSPENSLPVFRNIRIENVKAKSRNAIYADGNEGAPISNVQLRNVTISAEKAGKINHAENWSVHNVTLNIANGSRPVKTNCVNVDL